MPHVAQPDLCLAGQVAVQLQLEGAASFLESSEGQDAVLQADAAAKRSNVRGVPYYLISAADAPAKHVLSGAQPVDSFLAVFAKSVSEAA